MHDKAGALWLWLLLLLLLLIALLDVSVQWLSDVLIVSLIISFMYLSCSILVFASFDEPSMFLVLGLILISI